LRPENGTLPAIVVTRHPDGGNHFVVVWSAKRRVQVMDPAVGRRWVASAKLREELYRHEMELPATLWREWAGADEFASCLCARLAEVGADVGRVAVALRDPTWQAIATLDAACRFVAQVGGGDALVGALGAGDIPDDAWTVRPTDDPATLRVRGAVIVKATGYAATQPASPELRAALAEPTPRPWRHLLAAMPGGTRAAIAAALVATAVMVVAQAALWRALFDTHELSTLQLAGALGALVAFLAIELAIEGAVAGAVFRLGRRVELTLRAQFLAALGRLGLRYLKSRPISDMAERSHALHRLRELPWLAAQLGRTALTVACTGAALIYLAPAQWPLAVGLVLAVLLPPLLGHRGLAERELRARTHHGAITKFFLDALLGAIPARAHGVERAMRSEHEHRLVDWMRAAGREHAYASAVAAIQTILTTGFAIALVARHVQATDRPASVLLVVYWTVMMVTGGAQLAQLVRELPAVRNLTLRLLEPLGARGEDVAPRDVAMRGDIALDDVSVVAGGHVVLDAVTLTIPAGQHVAIVGASGAGKSTLLGLLLGWHRPASGQLTVGGIAVDAATLPSLRATTAWVDPSVQLWNDSLAHNLAFGSRDVDLGAVVGPSYLDEVLARLPEGMQTRLGESGGLLSGGEGQRVRFARGVGRRAVTLALLDEPFRGIDRVRRGELLARARERWAGATLICATHDLPETQGFARVLVVDGGKIVEDGAPAALAADPASRYAKLLADEAAAHALWKRWREVSIEGGRVV